MGVYIRGMEMPGSRPVCIVIDAAGQARCYDLNNDRYADDKLFEAVPVSPHGRLVDADVLYEDCALDNRYEVAATTTRINEYMQLKIDAAPTIIPAEQKGENK